MVGLTHARGRLFHGEGADLPVLFRVKCLFKIYVHLFPGSSKQTSKIDILLGEIRSSGEEKITHVCVCVCRGGATCKYIP